MRAAREGDAPAIHQLILDLAEYERAAHEVSATIEDIRTSLFAENPAVFAHVAEVEGEIVGCAIWFLNYSTWLGQHGIYLEDLYVKPEHRGSGIGKAFLVTLAKICVERGYNRFQWWVLDWNEPSIEFYKSIGAIAMDEWTVYRVTGDAIKKLANS